MELILFLATVLVAAGYLLPAHPSHAACLTKGR